MAQAPCFNGTCSCRFNGYKFTCMFSNVQDTQSDTVQNYNFTIHTVWQIVKDSFQSVYNCKIVSHKGGREYKSRVI